MTDRVPPQVQLWTWPAHLEPGRITRTPARPTTPVRIGDAERDQAVSTLGDHFAAGRLTREEFDTRADQAIAARFDDDLRPLFADLPQTQPTPPSGPAYAPAPGMRSALPLMLLWWLPFLMVGTVVAAVLIGAPWLIWGFIWVLVMSSFLGRHRSHRGYRYYR
ncbi:MAG TPA: DUF1707 domain-containing protein [Propionibacteriaceae bacterium]|jgi:hypothetical protein|nr:DUF1707 domain-containing protein [Propionibacteriaceae bacterium]